MAAAAVLCGLMLLVSPALGAETATPNDTARFLAGLQPSPGSPLAPLTQDRAWQQHAAQMNAAWADIEQRQLSKIRAWASANLPTRRPVTYYLFSGPDFLYVDSFFPGSSTYILAGLEPFGPQPDVAKLRRGTLPRELAGLRNSLGTLLKTSYFITSEMNRNLYAGQLHGTLPILFVFLARAGKTIQDVSVVSLAPDGTLQPDTDGKGATRAVKIVFSGPDNKAQTLYYFKTDLSNSGVRTSGFLQFLARLGIGDVFIKAASYLLHSPAFSVVRDFLLGTGASVVQDDTGIPVTYFQKAGWQLHPFGEYVGPIPMFRGHYQPKLDELFEVAGAPPIGFGVGYRWRPNQSHLLLAVSKEPRTAPVEPAAPAKATGPKDGTAPPPAPGSTKQRAENTKNAPKNARAKASKGTAADPRQGNSEAKDAPLESQAPIFPAPLPPVVPQAAHGAWRSLVLGGLIGVVLAGVFGPGGFAAGLTFVLQLGGIGGVMWLIASHIAGQEPTTAPPS